MTDQIEAHHLRYAASYVEECNQHTQVHTVTLTISGQHGGVDVTIEGLSRDSYDEWIDYKRTYEVH